MEYQEKYRHAQPTRRKTRLSCYAPMKVPLRTASKAPTGGHPKESEKRSFVSFSQAKQVRVSNLELPGASVLSASPFIGPIAWFCNEHIVKRSQRLYKNECAFVPTPWALNFFLERPSPHRLHRSLLKRLVVASCIPILSACAGHANFHRAESFGARQCVATVLLCDDCRY